MFLNKYIYTSKKDIKFFFTECKTHKKVPSKPKKR